MPKIFVAAPHCTLPVRDGASLRAWEIARGLGAHGWECLFLAKNGALYLTAGKAEWLQRFPADDARFRPALQSLLSGHHYLSLKHIAPDWKRLVEGLWRSFQPDTAYLHFLWTWPALSALAGNIPVFVDTHNFDPEWWSNLAAHSRTPFRRRICANCLSQTDQILAALPGSASLVHVSERDAGFYRALRPDLRHFILPNGCRPHPRRSIPDYREGRKRIYFLGLLSIQMSLDSLEYFRSEFWPVLEETAEFHVLGSRPTGRVRRLCRQAGWRLHPDLTEDQIATITGNMHYAILPFRYGAGSKLKLIDACGRGIPALSTPAGLVGLEAAPPEVFVSESATQWKDHLQRQFVFSETAAARLLDFARDYSWDRLTARFAAETQLS